MSEPNHPTSPTQHPAPHKQPQRAPLPVTTPEPVQDSLWAQMGGTEMFTALVDKFYEGVANDPELLPMYPEDDLAGAKHRLRTFLEQYFGGPKTYGEERGHPRLRMRHAPFPVSPSAKEAWLRNMRVAMDHVQLSPMHEQLVWDYFERAATSMINTYDGGPAPAAGQSIPDRLS